jgi:hypothetical protein
VFAQLNDTYFIAAELGILVLILVLFVMDRRIYRWHDRWMEYRLLAELIRQLRLLVPLGGGRPFPNVPVVSTAWASPTQSWMYWQMRAAGRAVGLPQARVTPEYLAECLEVMAAANSSQIEFHATAALRSRRSAHLLHAGAAVLFLLTLAGIVAHAMIAGFVGSGSVWTRALALCSAVLPAFASALVAISNQGEFVRLAKRSAAMADLFQKHATEIALLKRGPARPDLPEVAGLASRIAGAMVDEVADWRVVFADRPVTL